MQEADSSFVPLFSRMVVHLLTAACAINQQNLLRQLKSDLIFPSDRSYHRRSGRAPSHLFLRPEKEEEEVVVVVVVEEEEKDFKIFNFFFFFFFFCYPVLLLFIFCTHKHEKRKSPAVKLKKIIYLTL
jgi:hypothetical protein